MGSLKKRWTPATLDALGVYMDVADRWVIPTITGELRYSENGKPKMIAAAGMKRELWPRPEDTPGPVLVVVEGEPDAISGRTLGLPTVGLPGTGKDDPLWPARLATGRKRTYLLGDCDAVGRARMRKLAADIFKVGGHPYLVDLDEARDDGWDIGDLLEEAGPADAYARVGALMLNATPWEPPVPELEVVKLIEPRRTMEAQNMSTVTPEQMRFLWWPYLPLGKVVIVAGAPGHGKSQFASLIAAQASRGLWSPGDFYGQPSRVLMLCAEDDLPSTVVPRLMAVNADLRQIDTLQVRTEYPSGLVTTGMIQFPSDAEAVHEWARAHENARLVVMDPVASFFDRSHNTLFNQDVRDALGPMVAIAETYGVTVVIILHLNKSESKDFMSRIAESHGFQALARSVMALGPDPDDPERERGSKKVIAITKANLVKPGTHGLRCEIRSVTLDQYTPPIETSELVLTGKCEITADDLLISVADQTVRIELSAWLEEFLDGGWKKVNDVRKAARSDGYATSTVDRLARAMGYQRFKSRTPNGPWWLGAPGAKIEDVPEGCVSDVPETGEPSEPSTPSLFEDGEGGEGAPLPGEWGTSPSGEGSEGNEDVEGAEGREGNEGVEGFMDEFRRWEERRLGERDDDEEET